MLRKSVWLIQIIVGGQSKRQCSRARTCSGRLWKPYSQDESHIQQYLQAPRMLKSYPQDENRAKQRLWAFDPAIIAVWGFRFVDTEGFDRPNKK